MTACGKSDDLSQVCLQAVLSISSFRYAVGEGDVDVVELVPHVVGRGVQQDFDLVPELVGGSALALGVQDVVVRELGPRVRQRESDRGKKKTLVFGRQSKTAVLFSGRQYWSVVLSIALVQAEISQLLLDELQLNFSQTLMAPRG